MSRRLSHRRGLPLNYFKNRNKAVALGKIIVLPACLICDVFHSIALLPNTLKGFFGVIFCQSAVKSQETIIYYD